METPFTLAGLALQAPTIKKQIELNLLLAPMQAARLAADAAGAGPFAVAGLATVAHLKSEWAAQDKEAFEAAEKRDRAIIAAALTKWTYDHKPSQAAIIAAYNLARNYLESAELDPEFTAHYAYLSGAALHSKSPNSLSFEGFLAAAGAAPIGYDSPLAPVVTRPVLTPIPTLTPPAAQLAPMVTTTVALYPVSLNDEPADKAPPANSNPAKYPFTLADIDELATAVGIIDESRNFKSPRGGKGKGALVGFCAGLHELGAASKATHNRKALIQFFAERYNTEIKTNGAKSDVAQQCWADILRIGRPMRSDLLKRP